MRPERPGAVCRSPSSPPPRLLSLSEVSVGVGQVHYRHRVAPAPAAPAGPTRRGPLGACSDTVLLEHIRAQILGSRLHGEGYRKIWARLRHAGVRSSARRVRRLMGQHGLLAPHRVGRPERRAHDGTITTTAVDAMWGTDMTETVTIREGR